MTLLPMAKLSELTFCPFLIVVLASVSSVWRTCNEAVMLTYLASGGILCKALFLITSSLSFSHFWDQNIRPKFDLLAPLSYFFLSYSFLSCSGLTCVLMVLHSWHLKHVYITSSFQIWHIFTESVLSFTWPFRIDRTSTMFWNNNYQDSKVLLFVTPCKIYCTVTYCRTGLYSSFRLFYEDVTKQTYLQVYCFFFLCPSCSCLAFVRCPFEGMLQFLHSTVKHWSSLSIPLINLLPSELGLGNMVTFLHIMAGLSSYYKIM